MRLAHSLLVLTLISSLVFSSTASIKAAPVVYVGRIATERSPALPLDLDCKNGLCSLILPALRNHSSNQLLTTSSFVLQTLANNIQILPGNRGIQLADTVSLNTPAGIFSLVDADLTIELTPENTIQRLRGMAQVPLPSLGIFDNDTILAPMLAEVGLDVGRRLSHLYQNLLPDQPYLYFHLSSANNANDISNVSAGTVNSEISIPNGQSLTFIVDLQRPLIYVDGNLALRNLSQLALLSHLVGINSGLPFQFVEESARMHITGRLSNDAQETFLRLDGLYSLDPQFLFNWFGSTTKANQIYGSLSVNTEGTFFRGQVDASVIPEHLFAGTLVLEAFVPFGIATTQGYVGVQTSAAVPLLGFTQDQNKQIALANLNFTALQKPVQALKNSSQPMFAMVKDSTDQSILFAARGYKTTTSVMAAGYGWSVDVAVNAATHSADLANFGYQSTLAFAADSSTWLVDRAQFNMVQATGVLSATYNLAQEFTSTSAEWAAQQFTSSVDGVTGGAIAGYDAAKEAISSTYEIANDYVNGTVIDKVTETYDTSTAIIDDSLGQVQETLSCTTAQTQSWWCSTTGLCDPVECEP